METICFLLHNIINVLVYKLKNMLICIFILFSLSLLPQCYETMWNNRREWGFGIKVESSALWIGVWVIIIRTLWALNQLRNKHKRQKDESKSSGLTVGSIALDGRVWIWGQIDFLSFSPRTGFWMTHLRKCESTECTNASTAWCKKNCCPSTS